MCSTDQVADEQGDVQARKSINKRAALTTTVRCCVFITANQHRGG